MGLALTMRSDLLVGVSDATNDSIQAEAISSYLEVEERLRRGSKKAKMEEDTKLPSVAPAVMIISAEQDSAVVPAVDVSTATSSNGSSEEGVDEPTAPLLPPSSSRMGRWSLDEKLMFLYGLSLFGKGRWKKIHAYVPDR